MTTNNRGVDALRFSFGGNWERFLQTVNEKRIVLAELSLKEMLESESLEGKTFLDVGSGSGLFSLAARRLGAKVHSFDYDLQSVACTTELKQRYFAGDAEWTISRGSILEKPYVASLGEFDIVYAWGVLHHTGAMGRALENVVSLVRPNGQLYIAIYNYQERMTPIWKAVKRTYNRLPKGLRWLVLGPSLLRLWGPRMIYDLLRGKSFHTWRNYAEHSMRGMSAWHDVVDWVGGWPFEAARPEEIFNFYRTRGFVLARLRTCGGGLGCNEFVFRRTT